MSPGFGRADCNRSAENVPAKRRREGGPMGWLRVFLVFLATLPLAGCEAIGDIFQAGMAVGVFLVVALVAVIAFVIAKIRT
jgi:hypothetical protein